MSSNTIAVVGLGLSGLRTAMLAEQSGLEVLLFEVRESVGACLGSGLFDAADSRVLGLLGELGVNPVPVQNALKRFCFRSETCLEDDLWPEARESLAELEEAALLLMSDLDETGWLNVLSLDLDERSVGSFLDQHARSPRARWLMEVMHRLPHDEDSAKVSLLGWLVALLTAPEKKRPLRFPVEICAKMIASTPRLGYELIEVRREGGAVHLTFETALGRVHQVADRVVLCLPPWCLRQICFDPPLSEAKEVALEAMPMSRTITIDLEFQSRFWEVEGMGGQCWIDGPIQHIEDISQGALGILRCTASGEATLLIARLDDPVQFALDQVELVFPGAKKQFVEGKYVDWTQAKFTGGGVAYLPPGFVLQHQETLRQAEGQIHFAGGHTADRVSSIEGALESAERVMQELEAHASLR